MIPRGKRSDLAGHKAAVRGIAALGKLLASADSGGEVRVWDPGTGKLVKTIEVGGDLRTIDFSADGRALAVLDGERDPEIHVIDLETGRDMKTLDLDDPSSLAFDPQGKLLATGGNSGHLHLHDLGETLAPAPGR